MSDNKLIILGCGSSQGVPELHPLKPQGEWGQCDPQEPKNKRTRSSVYIHYNGLKLLIDTSPDLHHQYLREKLQGIDAVLYTHVHADHIYGIADLRTLYCNNDKKIIPVYSNAQVLESLNKSFPYLFNGSPDVPYAPKIFLPIPVENEFDVHGHNITILPQIHGKGISYGYRFGNLAYSTDFNNITDDVWHQLQGLDSWIVDCTWAVGPSSSHVSLPEIEMWYKRIKPKKMYLTHMGCTMDYATLCRELPDTVRPVYDGMVINF